jgi:glycosyltransferase involved in cell wall biosynthesis
MVQAFQQMGFRVIEVSGHARARVAQMGKALAELRSGGRIDFAYSESHTLPAYLTDPHHLPLHGDADYRFLGELRRCGVPVGLFYRDIHWRFEAHRHHNVWWKRAYMRPFFEFEWRRILATVDHLFLPALGMATHLPTAWPGDRMSPLPPGAPIPDTATWDDLPSDKHARFRLIYVGGVSPPLYDLTPLFDAVRHVRDVDVRICCREEEWARERDRYSVPDQIEIVHARGDALREHYAWADIAAIVWRPNTYLRFAMPVKLFEALGFGVPVITTSGTATADFVRNEGIGWIVDRTEDLAEQLNALRQFPADLDRVRCNTLHVRRRHDWPARAAEVAHQLAEIDRRTS